ncbi:hypothetical protein J45TS6_14140 [Paenibacillus sp. J45TS6]|uniref:endo-1,4-beta-xylanase n=1 Tax=Paenibacillus sp. J45TS6 TaxID=2807196 RepID=UPI001B05612E|nr:endo-1,4-beta-xylanase [Paenibacillus sp. J45TS6]GIP42955.1 hypothetical protein J45TS6_14140 [Paenibacillus sp. J45TS6]
MRSKISSVLAFIMCITIMAPQGLWLPKADAASVGDTVVSSDFETGVDQWFKRGSETVTQSTYDAQSGNGSLLTTGRTATWNGPGMNVTEKLVKGATYEFSIYAKLKEAGSATIELTLNQSDLPKIDGKENPATYVKIDSNTVTEADWVHLEGQLQVDKRASGYQVYVQSTDNATVDYYIDTFSAKLVKLPEDSEPTLPGDGEIDQSGNIFDFEDGQGKWIRRFGDGQISVTDQANHTSGGSKSLLTTISQQDDGPILDVLEKMNPNDKYDLSAWVKMAPDSKPTTLRISVQSGENSFSNVSSTVLVTSGEWIQLKGTYTVPPAPEVLKVYVESAEQPAEARSFYLDDFQISLSAPASGPKPLPIQTDIDALKTVYEKYFDIGAAVEPPQLSGNIQQLLDFHYNSVVAENSMKPQSLSPSEGNWNFSSADKIAKYAMDNNLNLRLHTLAWHSQAAEWMFQDENKKPLEATPENKQLVLKRLTKYIQDVLRHYKEMGVTIHDIDVVNEVIDEGQPDGMRKSEWYRLTGTDFIKTAFIVAREELPTAKLYINDYNTHSPKKRDAMFDLVMKLKDEGVPIDGVGHQTHINISGPSIEQISDSIRKFGEAGFDNQLTEVDVSVYTNNTTSYDTIPENLLVSQGYRYKELFKELIRLDDLGRTDKNPEGWISNVTLWGIADDHTWLHNRPIDRQDAPFPFDKQHQIKYAYWGMVEAVNTTIPSKLPVSGKAATAAQGTPKAGDPQDIAWGTIPAMKTESLGTLEADVKLLWDALHLYVRVAVKDNTKDSTDKIELFTDEGGNNKRTFTRGDSSVTEIEGGYVLTTAIPLEGKLGDKVKFDVRVTDLGVNDGSEQGGNGMIVSWSDPRNAQEHDTQGYGVLTYIEATKIGTAIKGTPIIDGELDAVWAGAPVYKTDVKVEQTGSGAAKADFRTMWDDENLYVYAMVTDSVLSDAIKESAHEQDSIEIFVDQNNGKTTAYQDDDGQYRINFKNVRTTAGHASEDNFTSQTKIVPGGYVVEAAISLDMIKVNPNTVIGFDLQVNDDQDGGSRDSVFIWNDPTGLSYTNTSRFGVLQFKEKETVPSPTPNPTPTPNPSPSPSPNTNQNTNESTSIQVSKDVNGHAIAKVSNAAFTEALKKVKAGRILFDIPLPSGTTKVNVKLPVDQIKTAKASGVKELEINAGLAKLVVPSILIPDSTDTADAEFSIEKVDNNSLTDAVRSKVGNNPVFDFQLTIGGKQISNAGKNQKIQIAIPYASKENEKKEQVVVYSINGNDSFQIINNGHYNPATSMVEFRVNDFSKFTMGHVDVNFTDLNQTEWAKESISALAARNIVQGATDQSFLPRKEVTRAEFVQMLISTLNLEAANTGVNFSDVEKGQWYSEAITAAYQAGIVQGKKNGTFGVHDKITREEMAVMTLRALKATEFTGNTNNPESTFADHSAISDYAKEAVAALKQAGIISGMPSGKFLPKATAIRAEAAVILHQLLSLN